MYIYIYSYNLPKPSNEIPARCVLAVVKDDGVSEAAAHVNITHLGIPDSSLIMNSHVTFDLTHHGTDG